MHRLSSAPHSADEAESALTDADGEGASPVLAPAGGITRRRSSSGASPSMTPAQPLGSPLPLHLVHNEATPASSSSSSSSSSSLSLRRHNHDAASPFVRVARVLGRLLSAVPLWCFDRLVWSAAAPDPGIPLRRIHGPKYQRAWIVTIGDSLFARGGSGAPVWQTVAMGAAALLLLCWMPLYLPPASSATLSPSLRRGVAGSTTGPGSGFPAAAPQRAFHSTEHTQQQDGRLSEEEMDRVLQGPTADSITGADVAILSFTEAESAYYFALQSPEPVEWGGWWQQGGWLSVRKAWMPAPVPSEYTFTRTSVDGITLNYQKAASIRVAQTRRGQLLEDAARAEKARAEAESLSKQPWPNPLDKALSAVVPAFATAVSSGDLTSYSAVAFHSEQRRKAAAAADELYERRHNSETWVEFQHTLYAWRIIPDTRRLKLVRNYTAFPSTVPSFLSLPPLLPLQQAHDATMGLHPDLPIPNPQTLHHPDRILLLYVFAYNHDEYMQNMEYFINRIVRAHQPIDYVFLINQIEGREVELYRLPPLPPNARYINHKNECYDWGTVGWIIDLQAELARDALLSTPPPAGSFASKYQLDLPRYKHFIIMNSSVRGPWFPSYIDMDDPRNMWWTPFLYVKLRDPMLKVVGCIVSCQISPHVQSYVLLLDQESFSILQGTSSESFSSDSVKLTAERARVAALGQHSVWEAAWAWLRGSDDVYRQSAEAALFASQPRSSPVFHCHSSWSDAVNKAEVGAGHTILKNGFNLGGLLRGFSGVDFRSPWNQECLGMEHNPSEEILTGGFITSGPDAAHIQTQIELLIARQNDLQAKRNAEEDEHDLEGDVFGEDILAERARTMARAEQAFETTDSDDWDWISVNAPRFPSARGAAATAGKPPPAPEFSGKLNPLLTHRRYTEGRNLDTALRIIAAARTNVLEASIRKLASAYREVNKGVMITTGGPPAAEVDTNFSPLSDLTVPLVPSTPKLRPDDLVRQGTVDPAFAAETTNIFGAGGVRGENGNHMLSLDFLHDLAADVVSYRARYANPDEADKWAENSERYAVETSAAFSTRGGYAAEGFGLDPFLSRTPLSPSVYALKLREAQHTLHMRAVYTDPLEVLFGKWKNGVVMRHAAAYWQYGEAYRERRMWNRARRSQRAVKRWGSKARNRWALRSLRLEEAEAARVEELRVRMEEDKQRHLRAYQEQVRAEFEAKHPGLAAKLEAEHKQQHAANLNPADAAAVAAGRAAVLAAAPEDPSRPPAPLRSTSNALKFGSRGPQRAAGRHAAHKLEKQTDAAPETEAAAAGGAAAAPGGSPAAAAAASVSASPTVSLPLSAYLRSSNPSALPAALRSRHPKDLDAAALEEERLRVKAHNDHVQSLLAAEWNKRKAELFWQDDVAQTAKAKGTQKPRPPEDDTQIPIAQQIIGRR